MVFGSGRRNRMTLPFRDDRALAGCSGVTSVGRPHIEKERDDEDVLGVRVEEVDPFLDLDVDGPAVYFQLDRPKLPAGGAS